MLDVYFEKHVDHAQVFKDRYLYVDRPERIDFIYSMGVYRMTLKATIKAIQIES